jgi:ankyrin repeat protein
MVHQFDYLGLTPLHVAAKMNLLEMCKVLCQRNSYVNKVDLLGRTPLYIATKNGHLRIVKYLLKQKAIPCQNFGNTMEMKNCIAKAEQIIDDLNQTKK